MAVTKDMQGGMVDGIQMKEQPHWLMENRRDLVGEKIENEIKKELGISLTHEKRLRVHSKVSEPGVFKRHIIKELVVDISLDGGITKTHRQKNVSDEYRSLVERDIKKLVESEFGKKWLSEELKNLGKRSFFTKPLG